MTANKFKCILNEFRPDLEAKIIKYENSGKTETIIIFPDGYEISYTDSYWKILNKLGISIATEKEINKELEYLKSLNYREHSELIKYTEAKLVKLFSADYIL